MISRSGELNAPLRILYIRGCLSIQGKTVIYSIILWQTRANNTSDKIMHFFEDKDSCNMKLCELYVYCLTFNKWNCTAVFHFPESHINILIVIPLYCNLLFTVLFSVDELVLVVVGVAAVRAGESVRGAGNLLHWKIGQVRFIT